MYWFFRCGMKNMQKTKIALFIYSLASGGAERVVSLLLPELMQKYDVTLVLMNESIEYNIPKNTKIYYLEKSHACESGIKKLVKIPFLAYKYYKFCQDNSIALSFSLLSRPNYINAIANMFKKTTKIVLSERSMPSMQYGYRNLHSLINKILIQYTYSKADLIITNSQGNLEDLKHNFKIQNKMLTLYNPIDLQAIENQKKAAINDFVFSDFLFTFISIGRLDFGKNHKLMIEAIKHVNNAQLLIIGDGILRDILEIQIKELHLENRVFLLGKKRNPYKYLARSDAFVFTSNHEGFPNVILEALACDLAIISTDCQSGPREILAPQSPPSEQCHTKSEYAEYGILLPLNSKTELINAMKKIMNDTLLANTYRKKAKMRCKDFEKEKIISQYIKVLDEQLP